MTVSVNGKHGAARGAQRGGLLVQLKVKREYTAVALNREVTPKAHYADTRLAKATGRDRAADGRR